jgi:5-methylcytosine-specific restriction protein A
MPVAPARPCNQVGCPHVAVAGGRCMAHQRPAYRQPNDRPSPSARGYDRSWQRVRAAYLKHNPECEVCGNVATDVHHIEALCDGGTHHQNNLMALCHSCHARFTARTTRHVQDM